MKNSLTSEAPQTSKPQASKPISARKASANRANAQRSTGPRTAAGKARSSLNALRHGILAKAAFNASIDGEENRAEFDALVAGFAQEFQPRTMTEHMMVQQLAGCYWRLAKVWRYEQEAAWRGWSAPGIPLEEYNQFHEDDQYAAFTMREQLIARAAKFLPSAGLDDPTIPNGAAARTVLRYQASLNTMLFRCINFLERRRKERMQSDEAFEDQDYLNEPTAEAAAPKAAEKPAEAAVASELPKRTQKDDADAPLSSHDAASAIEPAGVSEPIAPIDDLGSSEKP